jgi:glycosyltransferase involved in cell wall biosynthesis
MPLVSVIVPNYCHSKYLDQRIQSILNQSFQDFELIILDDCSPDNGASRAVIEKYRENAHVSHIIYNECNSGSPFVQWDRGMSLAQGSLIWIAESDDYCEKKLLKQLVDEFEKNRNLSYAFSLSQKVDSSGRKIKFLKTKLMNTVRLRGVDFVKRFMLYENFCINASACLFKKNNAKEISKAYMEYEAGGDYLFWIEMAEKGDVVVINDSLNYFRQHENKVTPRKVLLGVNCRESFRTTQYLLTHFSLTPFRKKQLLEWHWCKIHKTNFANEEIKKELLLLWSCPEKLSFFLRMKMKLVAVLRHRLSIYVI